MEISSLIPYMDNLDHLVLTVTRHIIMILSNDYPFQFSILIIIYHIMVSVLVTAQNYVFY